ncbi:TatD family hydrolase [Parabacteroides goldsteinii]
MNGLKRQINTVYYDIHAHSAQTSVAEDVVACYNVIVGKGTLSDVSSGQPVSCGIHPWYIREEAVVEQLARFRELALNEQVIMIGEAGLDKQISIPLDLQVKVFEEQIRVSEELKKPLIIHCVRAWEELIAIRKKCAPSMPWIIHGFRKKGEQAEQLLKQGFYLSFGEHFQESALRKAWPERLLIETDESSCPIQEIYQHIAAALQISVDELGNQVELTVHRLCSGATAS